MRERKVIGNSHPLRLVLDIVKEMKDGWYVDVCNDGYPHISGIWKEVVLFRGGDAPECAVQIDTNKQQIVLKAPELSPPELFIAMKAYLDAGYDVIPESVRFVTGEQKIIGMEKRVPEQLTDNEFMGLVDTANKILDDVEEKLTEADAVLESAVQQPAQPQQKKRGRPSKR